jgi:hypothetical protein
MEDRFAGCLAELEHRALLPQPCLSAFIVGSVTRGWDNGASDYDINLICEQPWPAQEGMEGLVGLDPPVVPVVILHVDGRRWEVKYWLDTQVSQMLAKVSWAAFEGTRLAGQTLTDTEEVFLERLSTCVPLAGEDWVAKRRAEIADSAFGAVVVTRTLARADSFIEDAIGQLAARDLESAVISAKMAFSHLVDALLESVGEYGFYTPKWRARRMRAAAPGAITFEDYWAIETMRGYDSADPGAWVSSVIRTCKVLSMKIEVPG